jgi:hypothetical protein
LIRSAVLAVALGATLIDQASAVWTEGDLITYTQDLWGDANLVGGALLMAQYDNDYAALSGLF